MREGGRERERLWKRNEMNYTHNYTVLFCFFQDARRHTLWDLLNFYDDYICSGINRGSGDTCLYITVITDVWGLPSHTPYLLLNRGAHWCIAIYSKWKYMTGFITHSSLVRSCVSLTRSLKHPKEYMLSRTSGSRSVKDRILFTHTRRGGGCSGQGSLRPLLIREKSVCGVSTCNSKHWKHLKSLRQASADS